MPLTKEDITQILTNRFPEKIKECQMVGVELCFVVDKETIFDLCRFVKESPELSFDFLSCLFGIDRKDKLEVAYILFSYDKKYKLGLKVELDYQNPEVESVYPIWAGAIWLERETAELFGIKFKNHPDPSYLLLPDDWDEGFPLRKDWKGKDFIRKPG